MIVEIRETCTVGDRCFECLNGFHVVDRIEAPDTVDEVIALISSDLGKRKR